MVETSSAPFVLLHYHKLLLAFFLIPLSFMGKKSAKMEKVERVIENTNNNNKHNNNAYLSKRNEGGKRKKEKWKMEEVHIFTCLFRNQKTLICCMKTREGEE